MFCSYARVTRVVLCLGEATFNHLAPSGWRAYSAGSNPTGYVHPRAIRLLQREGISTEGAHSKSWSGITQRLDVVITVCSSAAKESCPAYVGSAIRTNWGVEDPAHVTGTDEEIDGAFNEACRILRNRIEAFLVLPLEELSRDPGRLGEELDRIGAEVS